MKYKISNSEKLKIAETVQRTNLSRWELTKTKELYNNINWLNKEIERLKKEVENETSQNKKRKNIPHA